MEFAGSARKHGITDADALHAITNAVVTVQQDADRVLFLGPDSTGRLLEVGVLFASEDADPTVIHADVMRPKFRRYLCEVMPMPRTRTQLEHAAASAEAWLDNLDPDVTPAKDATELRAVAAALRSIATAEHELADAVRSARLGGQSWAAIAAVLGVSKQAASERYGDR